ncbi:hypothetical protein JXM83_04890 [Candidatus Woesearchaeota archaeon]|nr:hypothetical protein [Candidatus Woesearchaeota archaeon]
MKFSLIIIAILLFSTFVIAEPKECNRFNLIQMSKEIYCDGSPFFIKLDFKGLNYNNDFTVARFYGSSGIFFNTYPEIPINQFSNQEIMLEANCYLARSGFVELKVFNENNEFCYKKINLTNLNYPNKTSNDEIMGIMQNSELIDEPEKATITDYIIIGLGSIIFAILIYFIVIHPAIHKKI